MAQAAGGYRVFAGYADTLRPLPANFPTPFDTTAGITNEGQPSTDPLDSGAVRVVNTSTAAETVNSVIVKEGSISFDLWPHNVSLGAGDQLVLDQTAAYNFDTSDLPTQGCTNDGVIPTVTTTVNGVATTFKDTGQVLNTGGTDKDVCDPGANESEQWVPIGKVSCTTGATLTLTPATQNHGLLGTATVKANFAACGVALQGASVKFTVLSGPNAGKTFTGVTNASGNVSWSYTDSGGAGTDTVDATVTNVGGTITSNDALVNWLKNVTSVSGNAYGVGVAVNLLGGIPVTAGPTPTVTLPSAGGTVANSLLSLTVPNVLAAGVMDVSSHGTLGLLGGSQSRASTADAVVNGLLGATAVTSSCSSSSLGSTGSTSVVGLAIGSSPVINGTLAPNTTLTIPLIGTVILNEQIVTNTATSTSIDVNGVHVELNGILGTGNIIISHAHCDAKP